MMEEPLNRIIKNIAHETLPRSIRLRVSVVQSNSASLGADVPSRLSVVQTYAETARGERYFDERRTAANQPDSHVASFCDGTKCANLTFTGENRDLQHILTIAQGFMFETQNGFRDGPEPLRFYHVGLRPLHEVLPEAEGLGQERVIDRICDDFHFPGVGPAGREQSLVYSLDRETSVPLKIAAYAGPARIRDGFANWIWEAKSLDTISGRHYPLRSTLTYFQSSNPGRNAVAPVPELTKDIRVEEIEFDSAIPHTTFWPVPAPGAFVLDSISKKKFRVPGGEQTKKEAARTSTPVRVDPESGSWLPGLGVAASLAILAIAVFLWRGSR